jgi:SAM-dependent methyltransferase
VDARVGNAEYIPLPDASVDAIVSFETIEHLHQPDAFLAECRRLLAPGGTLVISTPNRPVYGLHAANNPFHHHEMTEAEFREALAAHFKDLSFFGQCTLLPRVLRLRGVRRLPTAFRRVFAPHATRAVTETERNDAQTWLQQHPTWRDRFDPYAVRSMPAHQLRNACYLVAVATRG